MHRITVLIAIAMVAAPVLVGQTRSKPPRRPPNGPHPHISEPATVIGQGTTTPSGVTYWDIEKGVGETAEKGRIVKIHYTGWAENGKEVVDSVREGLPAIFRLGQGQVIKGWDDGIEGMKVGGKRQLRVPPELAYGATGLAPYVLPNETVIFDIQLIGVQ